MSGLGVTFEVVRNDVTGECSLEMSRSNHLLILLQMKSKVRWGKAQDYIFKDRT